MTRIKQRRTSGQVSGPGSSPAELGAPGKRTLVGSAKPRQAKAREPSEGGELDAPVGAGSPLPEAVQGKMEQSFGTSFADVRVHEGPQAEAIGANAYAQGSDVHFAPGAYDPDSTPGQELLGHELAHVVQQRAGRVETPQGKSEINADDALEAEADSAGAAAARGLPVTITGATSASSGLQLDRHHATGPAGEGPNTVAAGAATAATVTPLTYAQIGAGTVAAFITYSDSRADWSMELTNPAEQAELRMLLAWLRAGDHRRNAVADVTVTDLIGQKANLAKLDAYGRAAADQPTVKVTAQTAIADMVSMGADILKLEAVTQGAILHAIFTPEEFDDLRADGLVDMFCTYVRTCAPVLHAADGKEINSFRTLAATVDPASFRDLRDVRNYHRFQEAALNGLRANQVGNPTNKPLTLILHTALDYNGAFHQDPELTSVVTNTTNHTIMIEGADSLDAISGRLPEILALHGRSEPDPADPTKTVKRIDQLMIAGHGSAMSIELAGTLATDASGAVETSGNGQLRTNEDGLDVRHDPSDPEVAAREARSRAFMQSLMALMSEDPSSPHRRIVFNACLTASNEIAPGAIDSSASPDEQAAQMRAVLATSPSLANAMRSMAPSGGPGVDVRGGNGSFGQVGLIDSAGALDIVADGTDPDGDGDARTLDPELTNPDKLVYVEDGTDPDGCMSAVTERWAIDRTTLMPAIQRRRAAPKGGGWKETLIQAMYELVETRYASNGAGIARLANVVFGFEELPTSHAAPHMIWALASDEDWTLLQSRLSVHAEWVGNLQAPMVFLHAWSARNAAKIPDFLTAVGAMTVRTIRPFLSMPALLRSWASFVPASSSNPPNNGELRLALHDLVANEEGAQATTKTFLSSLVTANAFTFDINPALDGVNDSEWALRVLGLHPSQVGSAVAPTTDPAAPPPSANVDMNADGINDSLVEAMAATGRVNVTTQLYVRDQATLAGRNHATLLQPGDEVPIMGQTGNWFLIDHAGVRGYSAKRYIDVLDVDAAGAVQRP